LIYHPYQNSIAPNVRSDNANFGDKTLGRSVDRVELFFSRTQVAVAIVDTAKAKVVYLGLKFVAVGIQ